MCPRHTRVACPPLPGFLGTHPAGQRNFPPPLLCPARCWRWEGTVPLEGPPPPPPVFCPPPPLTEQCCVCAELVGHRRVRAAQPRTAMSASAPSPGTWCRGQHLPSAPAVLLGPRQSCLQGSRGAPACRDGGQGRPLLAFLPALHSATEPCPRGKGQLGKVRPGSALQGRSVTLPWGWGPQCSLEEGQGGSPTGPQRQSESVCCSCAISECTRFWSSARP